MDETKQFGVPEVLAALEAAVAERGEDYVYGNPMPGVDWPACLYTHKAGDGTLTPGCIVGQVYFDLTGSPIPLTTEDQNGTVGVNGHTCRVFTPTAREILKVAQLVQDDGNTWGLALREARRVAERLQNG